MDFDRFSIVMFFCSIVIYITVVSVVISIEHSAKCFCKQRNLILYLLLFCRALFIITFEMEATQFGYSTKNIPIPSENDYKKALIEKTEHLCKRMRWKAHFFLNPENKRQERNAYGFNSKKSPSHILN